MRVKLQHFVYIWLVRGTVTGLLPCPYHLNSLYPPSVKLLAVAVCCSIC